MNECDGCGIKYEEGQIIPLEEVKNLFMRIEPGGTVPAGECPDKECGALCFVIKPEDEKK